MNCHYRIIIITSMCLLVGATMAQSQADMAGCADYSSFTRMPNFFIRLCERSEFDANEFSSEAGPISVEGKKIILNYFLKEGSEGPSSVAVVRNYINAIKKIGGAVVYDGGSRATLKMTKDKQEVWVGVNIVGVNGASVYEYRLDIVEKREIRQEVTAAVMINDITTTGRATLYGLYFDTGRSEIKSGSEPTLQEIVTMLKQNTSMKLFVVGHTDNVGEIGGNMDLSKARAESVVKQLTKNGVAAGQLAAYGVGSLSPVATNATEEGRALNRRVELVAR